MGFVPLNQSAPPEPMRGFVPLGGRSSKDVGNTDTLDASSRQRGFTPLESANTTRSFAETVAPAVKTMKAVGQVYPLAETAANLITQGATLPVAGLAGLGAAASKAVGLTDAEPADVVHSVAGALTYQPVTDLGKHLTQAAMTPFELLTKGGAYAGDKVLDATGSPIAATAIDTAINAMPMAISPMKKGATVAKEWIRSDPSTESTANATAGRTATSSEAAMPEPMRLRESAPGVVAGTDAPRGFNPLKEAEHAGTIETAPRRILGLETDARTLPESNGQLLEMVRGARDNRVPGMAEQFSDVPGGRGAKAIREPFDLPGATGRERELRAEERSLGNDSAPDGTPSMLSQDSVRGSDTFTTGSIESVRRSKRDFEDTLSQEPRPNKESSFAGEASANQEADFMQRRNTGSSEVGETLGTGPGNATNAPSARDVTRASIASGQPAQTGFIPLREKVDSAEVRNSFAPGANYAPLVDDSRAVPSAKSVVDLPDPVRREGIIKDLTNALNTTVYEGRVKGKNRLGFFRPKLEEVRIKRANDLEVAAHELAHLIDDRIPEIHKAWQTDKALAAELKSISYDSGKVYEGFAEGVRLWMTQQDVLQTKAPKVAAWLDDFSANHPYGKALKKAQADMSAWFGQDAINRARSKIGEHHALSEHFDRTFDKFRQSTVDDLHGIYQMERSMSGGKIAPVGAYETARLSRASASIADGAVRFGYPVKNADGSFTYRGKGLMDALKPVAENMDDALLYFVGRSSRELMQQGREHLFTKGEIEGMLKLRTPERDAAFKDYLQWNKGVLDFAEAQGVINPEARALWQRTQYLPFHRVTQPGTLKGKPGDWAGIKALTGGTENIKDVLGNMVANAAMLIDTAVKNEARLKVAELASQPGAGKFMVKIDPESRPVKVSGSQVMDAMLKRYGIAFDGNTPAFFEFFLQGQPPAGSNVVAVLKGGKPTWYEVGDPVLYRALTAIDRPPMHWITKWLGMPKRLGQMAITLTPDFMLANIARDTIMGSVMSRSGFRPVIDSLQGMRLRMTNDPLYKDYIANGGGLSSLFLDEHHLRTKLEKFYGRQGIDYRTVLDTPDKVLSFVETLGDAFEMSTRLGEYKRAIDKGEHPRHAAYQGREVSTDFAMRGDSKALGFLYDTVMFLRPAVVSMDRLFRGVAHDPNKAAIGAKTAMIALSSVGLYLLNREDPRYADLPDWDRDANWHFFIGDQHFRYPKIWEIGAVASLAERTVEKLVENNPQGMGKDFARIIANTFNLNFKPQIVAPLYEQATNRNSFTGSPIETPSMENVQPFLRAKPNTSETMKALGMATRDLPEALQVNPVRSEALLRGYLNTWASYGLMLSDQAFFDDKSPAMRTDQLPVVRRFYSQEPPLHTKFETKFYDMLGEAKRLNGTLKELDRMGRPEIADEKERSQLAGESKPLERAARNVQQVNAEMMRLHRDPSLTPEQKRQRIDGLVIEKNALLKATVKDAEAAQRIRH